MSIGEFRMRNELEKHSGYVQASRANYMNKALILAPRTRFEGSL